MTAGPPRLWTGLHIADLGKDPHPQFQAPAVLNASRFRTTAKSQSPPADACKSGAVCVYSNRQHVETRCSALTQVWKALVLSRRPAGEEQQAPPSPVPSVRTVRVGVGQATTELFCALQAAGSWGHPSRYTHTEADLRSVHGEINIQQGHTRRVPCRATQNPPTPGLAGSGEKHAPQGSATCRPWSRGQLDARTAITWHLPAATESSNRPSPDTARLPGLFPRPRG